MRGPKLSGLLAPLMVLLVGLPGCEAPPPEAYAAGSRAGGAAIGLGRDAAGEACRHYALPNGGGADVFCGAWKQPSARVRVASEAADLATQADRLAASLAPRLVDCGRPRQAAFAGADAALEMSCTLAAGGWPHTVLVVRSGGRSWYAEGVQPAVPAMHRSIGVLLGRVKPETDAANASLPMARGPGKADTALYYQELMREGARANHLGNWEQAATLFRSAIEVQERSLGHDSPMLVEPLTGLGMQLSNQGRHDEARATFARAGAMAARSGNALSLARLAHYQGLHELNQGHARAALEQLRAAERLYAATLPPDLPGTRLAAQFDPHLSPLGTANLLMGGAEMRSLLDAAALEALLGVVETRRNQAIALRKLGDAPAAAAAIGGAEAFARAQGLTEPLIFAFVHRTAGVTALEDGRFDVAMDKLDASIAAFNRGLGRTRPLAEAQLRRADARLRSGRPSAAIADCRAATELLRDLKRGVNGTLIQPCLAAYAEAVGTSSEKQRVLAEMFETAQLARGAITAQQIQQAAVRLAAAPEIGGAVRAHDGAEARLNELLRQQDERTDPTARPSSLARQAALQTQISAARRALETAEDNLKSALPNYNSLVQQLTPAAAVLAALRPGEAFASITLAESEGWIFLLRDGTIRLGRIDGGLKRMATLVARLRVSIELSGRTLPRFDTAAAQELYGATLGQVAEGLNGATALTIVPTGPLLSIPAAVLLTGPAAGQTLADAPFLVRRFPISHVPSAANLVSLRRASDTTRAGRPWFGMGDPLPIDPAQAKRLYPKPACAESVAQIASLPILPGTRRELEAVRLALGGLPSEELVGAKFTRSAVLAQPLQDYRILHFAAHALLPSEIACQDEPAIVTSLPATENVTTLLTASDILLGLKLDADAVVLSACNSGGPGGNQGGESLSGLARSFFFAGARALLVTHWAVNDDASAYLVAHTLAERKLRPDQALAPALRKVQLEMMATEGYDHPYFWAPMALIGEGGGGSAPSGSLF